MLKVCCDFCDRPLPLEEGNVVRLFKTKEINTQKLYPNMCESCANKIDEAVRYDRGRKVTKAEIIARMARKNEERRKLLNTKG